MALNLADGRLTWDMDMGQDRGRGRMGFWYWTKTPIGSVPGQPAPESRVR